MFRKPRDPYRQIKRRKRQETLAGLKTGMLYSASAVALASMIAGMGWLYQNGIMSLQNPFSESRPQKRVELTYVPGRALYPPEQEPVSSTPPKVTNKTIDDTVKPDPIPDTTAQKKTPTIPDEKHEKSIDPNFWERFRTWSYNSLNPTEDVVSKRSSTLLERVSQIEKDLSSPAYLAAFKKEVKENIQDIFKGAGLDSILKELCDAEGIPYQLEKAQYDAESGSRQWDKDGNLIKHKVTGALGYGQLLPDGNADAFKAVYYPAPSLAGMQEHSNILDILEQVHGDKFSSDLKDLYQLFIDSERGIGGQKSIRKNAQKKLKSLKGEKYAKIRNKLKQAIRKTLKAESDHRKNYWRADALIKQYHDAGWKLVAESGEYNLLTSFAYQRRLLNLATDGNLEVKPLELLQSYAMYVRGLRQVNKVMRSQKGIPNDKATRDYLHKIPIENGLEPTGRYWVPKGSGMMYITRGTGIPEAEILKYNPGLDERIKKEFNFPIVTASGVDPYAPVFTLKKK